MEDIEIARNAKLEPVTKIAMKLGIDEENLEQYGKYKAKISLEVMEKILLELQFKELELVYGIQLKILKLTNPIMVLL